MLSWTLALLATYWAAGILAAMATARAPAGPGFYRLATLLALGGVASAVALRLGVGGALPGLGGPAGVAYGVAGGGILAFGLTAELAPGQRPFAWLVVAAVAAGAAALADPELPGWQPSLGRLAVILYLAGAVTSILALGAVILAMVLAHWYLVEPRLPLEPLCRLLVLLAASEAAKLVQQVGVVAHHWPRWAATEGGVLSALAVGDALFVAIRVVLGVLAPLALTWMAWRAAAARSIQSATGILYAAVVLVVFGETVGTYLAVATGEPY